MKYLTGLIFVENAVAREIFDFSRPFWRSAEVIERPTTCDVLAGERDVEVVVELRVVRRDEGKFPAHAPADGFNLVDRRPRHRCVTDVVVLKMDQNAFEMVDFQRATDALRGLSGPHHEVLDKELATTGE